MVGGIEEAVEQAKSMSGEEQAAESPRPKARKSPRPKKSASPSRPPSNRGHQRERPPHVRPLARDAGRHGVRGGGADGDRPWGRRRDRRPPAPRPARRLAEGRRDTGARGGPVAVFRGRARATSRCSGTAPSSSSTTPYAPRRSTSSRPGRGGSRRLGAALERADAGEEDIDRWQLEQRLRHAENKISVAGR